MIETKKIKLGQPYISKKIEASAFKTVLASTYQTAYRLYIITAGDKELQEFAELKHDEYSLSAYVKTQFSPAGDAKRQIWSVKHLQPLLSKKPKYELKCTLTHKMSNKEVYKCNLVTINKSEIYNQIQECIEEINKIL